MKKLIAFITHPLTLSLFITILIAWLLFPSVPKYELKIKEHNTQSEESIDYFDDLDGNGYSDRIMFHPYPNRILAVSVRFNPSGADKEWELRGQFAFIRNENFITGDYDGNGEKEICVFTVSHDSLLLHCISGLYKNPPVAFTRFIQMLGYGDGDSVVHVSMVPGGMEDLNRDGFKELVFGVNYGISTSPRNIYSYDIRHDILTNSPKNGYFVQNLLLEDINGDGTREIIVNGYASQNYKDSIAFPVNDLCCRLIVLDRKLQYLFPPVRFPYNDYSDLTTLAIPDKLGKKGLYSLYSPPPTTGENYSLYHFDEHGNLIRKQELPGTVNNRLYQPVISYKKGVPYLVTNNLDGQMYRYDTAFRLIDKSVIPYLYVPYTKLDIDGDQEDEHLFFNSSWNGIAVFRQDMGDPAVLISTLNGFKTNISLKKIPGKSTQLVIDSGPNLYYILYYLNPLYYTRWLIFTGLFVALYLFILLIARLQRIRFENRMKTEKKITELQMKIVRNQMDPHFTMNAINAVIDAINREEKEEARENLLHFSKMYRSLVLSADKIKRSLREELEFTENYLALEQFRFNNRFTWKISIDPNVNPDLEVPKMVIQSPVENAVKHGLLKRESGGEVLIHAYLEGHQLVLEITDNGVGREQSSKSEKSSTGKGMQIMEQFFDLYQKITGVKVFSEIYDLCDPVTGQTGTKVMTVVELKTIPGT